MLFTMPDNDIYCRFKASGRGLSSGLV